MLIVSVDGDVGVVQGLEKGQISCLLCASPHCKHSAAMKHYQRENGLDEPFSHEMNMGEDAKLFSYQALTIELNEKEKLILNKRPQEIFRMVNIGGIIFFSFAAL